MLLPSKGTHTTSGSRPHALNRVVDTQATADGAQPTADARPAGREEDAAAQRAVVGRAALALSYE